MATIKEYREDADRIIKAPISTLLGLAKNAAIEGHNNIRSSTNEFLGDHEAAKKYEPKDLGPIGNLMSGMVSDGLVDAGMYGAGLALAPVTGGLSVPGAIAARMIMKAPKLFKYRHLLSEIVNEVPGAVGKGVVAYQGAKRDGKSTAEAVTHGINNGTSEAVSDTVVDRLKIPKYEKVFLKPAIDAAVQFYQDQSGDVIEDYYVKKKEEEEKPKSKETHRMTRAQAVKFKGPMDEFYFDPLL